ncbi:MAG: hypothetical protein ABI700_06655 [Chloroflexota bacterium]
MTASPRKTIPLKTVAHRLLLGFTLLVLLVAAWAGLIRIGWTLPPFRVSDHGPLMIAGFLGTLIALERAIALAAAFQQGRWAYAVPVLSALGALGLLVGLPRPISLGLILLASLGLSVILGIIVYRQPALFTGTMALGAICWLVGNGFWAAGQPIYQMVAWWVGFLVLTVAGERLELSRILRPSLASRSTFVILLGLLLSGMILTMINPDLGTRLSGIGLLALGAWLLRYDIARRTVKQTGLTRYIALCLLSGYLWLLVGGALGLWFGGTIAGPAYDAILHSIFLGFVISMVFGHAPMILPAVMQRSIPYHARFYLHLILLHLSLILRIVGDLSGGFEVRRWGGLLNGIALLVFLGITAYAVSRQSATQQHLRPVSDHRS